MATTIQIPESEADALELLRIYLTVSRGQWLADSLELEAAQAIRVYAKAKLREVLDLDEGPDLEELEAIPASYPKSAQAPQGPPDGPGTPPTPTVLRPEDSPEVA